MSQEVPEQQMPTSEAPANVKQQERAGNGEEPRATGAAPEAAAGNGAGRRGTSRWIDYDTHELLEMISELEDERRFARLREGVLWAILFHIALLFAIFLIPKYLLKMTPAIETSSIQDHKNFTYLDSPFVPRPKPVKPLLQQPEIDRKTLEEMKRQSQAPPPPAAPPQPVEKAPAEQKPQTPPPIPPTQQSQSPVEAPHAAAVPARPNFAQLEHNPANQLQQDMQNAMHSRGTEGGAQAPAMGGLPMHPGAGAGGLQILSDTQGVDFSRWMSAWYYETRRTWDPLIPDEVNPPIRKQGQVLVHFKVLPNGRVMDGSMTLDGRSGDTGLDRAAWGAIQGASYPPLPRDFHGPYLELRAWFLYNMEPPGQ